MLIRRTDLTGGFFASAIFFAKTLSLAIDLHQHHLWPIANEPPCSTGERMTSYVPRELETPQETVERERCEQWTHELFRTSPMVRFMAKHLSLLDCDPLSPRTPTASSSSTATEAKVVIAPCPPTIAGGFSPSGPREPTSGSSILLCSNQIMSKAHLEDTLAHEMVHWFDHCRFLVDWSNLRHHACSEIRAASLSGDCNWAREWQRRNYGFKLQHQKCVKRRAVISILANPACNGDKEKAERTVDEVFDSCFRDTRPFDEVGSTKTCPQIHSALTLLTLILSAHLWLTRTDLLTSHTVQMASTLTVHFDDFGRSLLDAVREVEQQRGKTPLGKQARSASRARGLSLSRR
ncbi:ku70-binding protein [Moesziomyces antarcticus T-34]|uniref:Mitochondrial inner membrane protease ATP23 n=1 Tax=Pseudozyma antarctica (strain T-34) TaxID=1151754 RepID=M9MH14_PSEA3|nr:ku70-binding protein [Moesziomyces antarcticus T-34]